MSNLFSPIIIARKHIPNRIVMAPVLSGYAMADGFIHNALCTYYDQRAQGGVGMIITEPMWVVPPSLADKQAHLGLYADVFVPSLRSLAQTLHLHGTRLLITLNAPTDVTLTADQKLIIPMDQFIQAAWRALAADCDGIVLSLADGGILQSLLSPTFRHEGTHEAKPLTERLWFLLQIIEQIRARLGAHLIIGVRLIAEDFTPDGIRLHDARVIAKRVVAAGASLLDVTVETHAAAQIARFPGWIVPLAEGIKQIVGDVPVITSGFFGDFYLADSVIRDGSADMIMLADTLRTDPNWPHIAYTALSSLPGRSE